VVAPAIAEEVVVGREITERTETITIRFGARRSRFQATELHNVKQVGRPTASAINARRQSPETYGLASMCRTDRISFASYQTFAPWPADFKASVLTFLREEVPRKWHTYCDQVTDNFRIISPKDFRVLT
jgi:hypothetical protein